MKNNIILFLLIIIANIVHGQQITLENYVRIGLENNLALKQKKASYNKSLEVLNQARAYFLPQISLNARYSIASGGRTIEFPVGDMLNPVYYTLNELTGTNDFPTIDNQVFYFYRDHEQETKLELIQPIINPSIAYNYKISKELSNVEMADLNTFKRQLIADIKTAYYSYLKTIQLFDLVNETRILLEENIRVNKSLFNNEKVTIDVVYRSEAELSKLEQNEAIVVKNKKMATSWFNFLLNRPFDSEIDPGHDAELITEHVSLYEAENLALKNREELNKLDSYINVAEYNLKLHKSNRIPNIFAAVNYGIQGTDYRFSTDDDFFLGSLVLRWDLFKGFENKAKIGQSRIELDKINTKKDEVTDQIRLEVAEAYYNLEAAYKFVRAVQKEKESAGKAFRVIDRKYVEGMVTLVEFIDSRTTMTTASANYIISKFEYQIIEAEFERVRGTYFLPEINN